MSDSIQAVIIGAAGYVGGELLRLLHSHPEFELRAAVSASHANEPIGDTFQHLSSAYGATTFTSPDNWLKHVTAPGKLALFSAAPHGASAALIAAALEAAEAKGLEVHVVDSSADFRYSDATAVRIDLQQQPRCARAAVAIRMRRSRTPCRCRRAACRSPRLFRNRITAGRRAAGQIGPERRALFHQRHHRQHGIGSTAAARHASPGAAQQPVRIQAAATSSCA